MKVVITDAGFKNIDHEKEVIEAAGYEVELLQLQKEEELLGKLADADALIVQWGQISAAVIDSLEKCKVIVRYGIGTDNVDLDAAKEKGIPVCNIPDYCIDEVADHTLAMALAFARQLPQTGIRFRSGQWAIVPPHPLPNFGQMIFGTAGFGRIARAVLQRAKAFNFQLISYDPYTNAETMKELGVSKVDKDELIRSSDILSLNIPLNEETHHFIDANTIDAMKNSAILVNTSRGGLIDTVALADKLKNEKLLGAGLDVFETEPLEMDHPILDCHNAILTSHTAWYSEQSVPRLQRLAAEEAVRALSGEEVLNKIN